MLGNNTIQMKEDECVDRVSIREKIHMFGELVFIGNIVIRCINNKDTVSIQAVRIVGLYQT